MIAAGEFYRVAGHPGLDMFFTRHRPADDAHHDRRVFLLSGELVFVVDVFDDVVEPFGTKGANVRILAGGSVGWAFFSEFQANAERVT